MTSDSNITADPYALLTAYRSESTPAADATIVWRASKSGSVDGLSDFLQSLDPTNAGPCDQKRFIWFILPHKRPPPASQMVSAGMKTALARIEELLSEVGRRLEGFQGSKEEKDLIMSNFAFDARSIATGSGLSTGKWVLQQQDKHKIFEVIKSLAYSLVKGALNSCSSAVVHSIRVDCAGERLGHGEGQEITVYFEDVWDRESAREVAEVLLNYHGQQGQIAKADVYGVLNITNEHWSGMPSFQHTLLSLMSKESKEALLAAHSRQQHAAEHSGGGGSTGSGATSSQPPSLSTSVPVKRRPYIPSANPEDSHTEDEEDEVEAGN